MDETEKYKNIKQTSTQITINHEEIISKATTKAANNCRILFLGNMYEHKHTSWNLLQQTYCGRIRLQTCTLTVTG